MIGGTDGSDRIEAGRGDGFIDVQGGGRVDRVDCGSGQRGARQPREDNLSANCEVSKAL